MDELAIEYKKVSDQIRILDSQKDGIKAELLTIIGDAEKVKGSNYSISAGLVGPSEYTVKREGYRNFKITFKKPKEGLWKKQEKKLAQKSQCQKQNQKVSTKI